MAFYDGTKLLSLKDINGNTPEIYICTSNRSAGKSTYFNRLEVNRFLKRGEKFGVLYRFNYELDEVSKKFFSDIQRLFFSEYEMLDKSQSRGMYHELFLKKKNSDEEPRSCGYAISLNNSDQIKKMSHLFSDITSIIFDEFQSETSHYCPNEVKKFQSVHASIARGNGKQSRYVPVYMISNPVSIINPYFSALGISSRLKSDTHFMRGNGFVLENGFNESASNALCESTFNRAFDNSYNDYIINGSYLMDSSAFIEKMSGFGSYLFTLKCDGKYYSVVEYAKDGIIYVSDSYDESFKTVIAVDVNDHDVNYVLLSHYDTYIQKIRFFFEHGCFRFKNQNCKSALMKLLNYNLY